MFDALCGPYPFLVHAICDPYNLWCLLFKWLICGQDSYPWHFWWQWVVVAGSTGNKTNSFVVLTCLHPLWSLPFWFVNIYKMLHKDILTFKYCLYKNFKSVGWAKLALISIDHRESTAEEIFRCIKRLTISSPLLTMLTWFPGQASHHLVSKKCYDLLSISQTFQVGFWWCKK